MGDKNEEKKGGKGKEKKQEDGAAPAEKKSEAKPEKKEEAKSKAAAAAAPVGSGGTSMIAYVFIAVAMVVVAYVAQKMLIPPAKCTEQKTPVMWTKPLSMTPLARMYFNKLQEMKRIDVPDQKFLLYEETNKGFGNKLRGLASTMLLCIQYDRIMLLGESFDWLRDFFRQPPSMHPWSVEEAKILNTIQLKDDAALRDNKLVPIPFMPANLKSWVKSGSYDKQRWWKVNWMDVSTAVFRDWPEAADLLGIENGTALWKDCAKHPKDFECRGKALEFPLIMQISRLFADRQSGEFKKATDKLKQEISWENYDLYFALHLRTCVDCGNKPDEFVHDILACIKKQVETEERAYWRKKGCSPRSVLYVATDSPTHVPMVADGLRGVIDVVSHPNATTFVHTNKENKFEELLIPMSDWWMLGEADVAFSGMVQKNYISTFFTSAVGRKKTRTIVVANKDVCELTPINQDVQ